MECTGRVACAAVLLAAWLLASPALALQGTALAQVSEPALEDLEGAALTETPDTDLEELDGAVPAETPPAAVPAVTVPAETPPDANAEQLPDDVFSLISEAANRWGVNEAVMLRIAWCESRFDPDAVGPGRTAGLFQFAPITWPWVAERAGFAGASPLNARANAEAAAWLLKHEGPRHWGCK